MCMLMPYDVSANISLHYIYASIILETIHPKNRFFYHSFLLVPAMHHNSIAIRILHSGNFRKSKPFRLFLEAMNYCSFPA